ncbi:ATP-binding protein [Flavobacterium sp. C3NV]|uniref:ATP-binding protein n=1 Tax=Flavobacterium sp. C3NV TaxID=3393358 RepID=UPI00398F9BAD
MAGNVNVTSNGIKKILSNYDAPSSIAEYIWNGFDAKANTVAINYTVNNFGSLEFLEIIDNGYGINHSKLNTKFKPFYESEKAIKVSAPKHTSTMHGKNGVGRLTFFTFAHSAKWLTTFLNGKKFETNTIIINSNELIDFKVEKAENEANFPGTIVTFTNMQISENEMNKVIIPFLIREFCWFLELNKPKNFQIKINNIPLDYKSNIAESDEKISVTYSDNKSEKLTEFKIKFIQWKESLHQEYSKYYFLNEKENEVYKDHTTLNKKGDEFFHSVYIQSDYFKDFDFNSSENETQGKLFGKAKSSPEYRYLIKVINQVLRDKRKPFLRQFADKLIENYEENGILPNYKTEWEERFKKEDLIETLKSLYEIQPKLFTSLNINQKKTFVRFLDLLLDSNEREDIFKVLDEILDLSSKEREDLAKIFKTTKLNRVIETLKLIQDRYETINILKELVYNKDLKANEVDHLQKLIESHYWIFGEQYHLVTAAEPKFEEALRRYIYLLTDKDTNVEIDHPHRLKEMDIFACRQNTLLDKIENIVVELKHPQINLGNSQYSQVYNYMELIQKQPEFNAPNMSWEFYLIGNKFDSTNFLQNQIITNKPHGTRSLIMHLDDGRIKVYAKTWSEIFADFEIKYNYLNEKLKLERELLVAQINSADQAIKTAQENSAIQLKEIKLK